MSSPAAAGASVVALSALVACGGGGRDTVPVSADVVGERRAPTGADEGYEYVARRPLAVVALAEARGVDPALGRAAIDRLADTADRCAGEQRTRGRPSEGAARVVAQIEPDGRVGATSVKIDPTAGGAEAAVLCLVAPLRLLTFPPTDGGARGMAIEALWGPKVPPPPAPP